MRVCDQVKCIDFPCTDARRESYNIPAVDLDPAAISLILISEASPAALLDDYYMESNGLYARTTLQAFREAGVGVSSIQELVTLGVYLTNAVKCGKYGYTVATHTITSCSSLLEQEIDLFPNVKAFLLMGDVAIKALNTIAKRQGGGRVVPAGSTYRIRGGEFHYRGKRIFPSYLQAGPSFGIEKSKQRMIAQDIHTAMYVAGIQ